MLRKYRNQSIDLHSKSFGWLPYDKDHWLLDHSTIGEGLLLLYHNWNGRF